MTEISVSSSSKALLLQCMQPDDEPTATELARRKANTPKTSRFPFLSRPRKQSAKKYKRGSATEDASSIVSNSTSSLSPTTNPPAGDEWPLMTSVESDTPNALQLNTQIELECLSAPLEDDSRDVYRWAVVYENQRGITMFSIPYYSHLSLLPWDPPAFTFPDASQSSHGNFHLPRSHKPTITLSSYPLPNGDWKWVSKSWMIDMRGDGQVQYDGFEYNWFFRKRKWSATSAAWVRRRRWIRLMMRPAKRRLHPSTQGQISSSVSPSLSVHLPAGQGPSPVPSNGGRSRYSWKSGIQSLPPSVLPPHSIDSSIAPGFIWQGDGVDDWERCHDYLRSLTRDGRKLEVWKSWLGLHAAVEIEGPKENVDGVNITKKQWTEDEGLLPSQAIAKTPKAIDVSTTPPREWIVAAIREHMEEILQTFVYPDSRAQFITLLRMARSDFGEDAERFLSSYQSEFWSYTFLNPGALASSVSMSAKEGKRKEQSPIAEDTDDRP